MFDKIFLDSICVERFLFAPDINVSLKEATSRDSDKRLILQMA